MNVLGISAFYHDAAAALVADGTIVAAAQEERFTRRKHDASLPLHSIAYCLERGGVAPEGIDRVVFYEKPIDTFARLLRTSLQVAPAGFGQFRRAMPIWMREKLWIPYQIERGLASLGYRAPRPIHFTEHHESHAASAFYPSPFERAAVLTFDGVGEWTTSSIGTGRGNEIELHRQMRFPHSLGLLYSAFTAYCGFRVNSGEYKLMGLAPFGEPSYVDTIMRLVDLREDGSFSLDLRYFGYLRGTSMTNRRFDALFGGPARRPESPITRREADLARSIQEVVEEIVLRIARHAAQLTGERDACLAGGVALNCVSNARLLREGPFDRIWVQPAAGDAGGALGAALHVWHQLEGGERVRDGSEDGMSGCALGPRFGDDEIRRFLDEQGAVYEVLPDRSARARRVAERLAAGKVVALLADRMEFGPRALGNRSILADPRRPEMQALLNSKTKRRESFRPFAPAVLAERARDWFDLEQDDPYMTLVAPVRGVTARVPDLDAFARGEKGALPDGPLPATTHIDGTARVQTVDPRHHAELDAILRAFEDLTGCPVLLNTSFNVRGEPIVCTPEDAYRCFTTTEIDHLVLGGVLLDADAQPLSTPSAALSAARPSL